MATTKPRALIFDLGDVSINWSPSNSTSISSELLAEFRSSHIWHKYNCSQLREEECYAQLETLRPLDETMTATIRDLKAAHKGRLRVYAMSNVSRPDWEIRVVESIGVSPKEIVFIDDREDNVLAARSLGIRGILFTDAANVRRQFLNILADPVKRGRAFLNDNAQKHYSVTDQGGITVQDNSQLLILEATGNLRLVTFDHPRRTWNYYIGDRPFNPDHLDDLDTTALAFVTLP
ncbi:hypothetical protein VTN00DRAFT_2694 [Thermoascus crustaceus]|uniref:uncharacterized protein n=1 Tax=Thermoascus crustaceus TaxID=5088 RepID=UPI003742BB80